MEPNDTIAPTAEQIEHDEVHPVEALEESRAVPSQEPSGGAVPTQTDITGPAEPSHVYAIGQIDARFPSLGVEQELNQVAALMDTAGLTEREVLQKVIVNPQNRYLARSLCWLLLVQGLETYLLLPRDPRDYDILIDAYRADPSTDDIDVVIGTRGPIATPDMCNGVVVPIVVFDNLYSFTRKTLVDSIPTPPGMSDDDAPHFRQTASGVFNQIVSLADNAGATDAHRAVNYLVVRYPQIYTTISEANDRSASLTGIEVRPSPLSGVRRIVEVIFSFTDRQTDVVEKQFARVDVSEPYPFLATKLGPYFER